MAFSDDFVSKIREITKEQIHKNQEQKAKYVEQYQRIVEEKIVEWLKKELECVTVNSEKLMLFITDVKYENSAKGQATLYLCLNLVSDGPSNFSKKCTIMFVEVSNGMVYSALSNFLDSYLSFKGVKVCLREILSSQICLYDPTKSDV